MSKVLASPLTCDIMFGIVGVGSLVALAVGTGHGDPAIAAAAQPLRAGLSLVAVLIVAVAIGMVSSRLDRAKDEYVYRLLTRSALTGMVALVFATTFWSMGFEDNLGRLSGELVLALALAAWALGYLHARVKGTAE